MIVGDISQHFKSFLVIIGAVFLGWRKSRKQMPIDVLLMSNCKNDCHWSNSPACRVSAAEGRKECKVRASKVAKAEQVETFPNPYSSRDSRDCPCQYANSLKLQDKEKGGSTTHAKDPLKAQ